MVIVAVAALWCWLVMDMSSAQEAMPIWGVWVDHAYRGLKSVDDKTDPWGTGTPFLKFLVIDAWPFKFTWSFLSAK